MPKKIFFVKKFAITINIKLANELLKKRRKEKQKREEQLQQQNIQMQAQANQQLDAEIEAQKKAVEKNALDSAMKKLLTPEARSRIATISLATPERSEQIKQTILQLFENQTFTPPMSDEQLKKLLISQSKRTTLPASPLGTICPACVIPCPKDVAPTFCSKLLNLFSYSS